MSNGGPDILIFVTAFSFGVIAPILLILDAVFKWFEEWDYNYWAIGIGIASTGFGVVGILLTPDQEWLKYFALAPTGIFMLLMVPYLVGGFSMLAVFLSIHHVKWCRKHNIDEILALLQVILYAAAGTLILAFVHHGKNSESGVYTSWAQAFENSLWEVSSYFGAALWGWQSAIRYDSSGENDKENM